MTVTDGTVTSIDIKQFWFEDNDARAVGHLVTTTVNKALAEWGRQQLDQVMNLTPDMRQLSAAINTARDKLDDAWIKTLADAKVPAP